MLPGRGQRRLQGSNTFHYPVQFHDDPFDTPDE